MTVLNMPQTQRQKDIAQKERAETFMQHHEEQLRYWQEQHREVINRLGLNKPDGPEDAA